MVDVNEECIKQALKILEVCGHPDIAIDGVTSSNGADPGEILLRRLSLLVDTWREPAEKLAQTQKELAVFKEANIDTNRMLEKKIEEISLLRLITDTSGRAIRSEDPLRLILQKVVTITGAKSGSIMLRVNKSDKLEIRAVVGPKSFDKNDTPPALEEIARRVIESRESQIVNDTGSDTHESMSAENAKGIGALAAFPLMSEKKTVGILALSSPFPDVFGPETERIMHIIAGQVAIATENARLYGEVKETKEYLENLVERAGDAIFTLDKSRHITSWNAGAEVIFQNDKKSVVGKSIYDLIPEKLASELEDDIKSALESDTISTVEVEAPRGDGKTVEIALTLSPIHDAEGEVVAVSGIAKDISKHKQIEEELRQLNEAKSNFVSTVSHELRTPLTSIKSLTEVLLQDMESLPEENVRNNLNIINEECDHLSDLISSVLELQKLSAGKLEIEFEPISLAQVTRQVTRLFDGMAFQSRIELSSEFLVPDDMTTIMGDRKRLARVLSNLLSNALKYSHAGGHVHVCLTRENDHVRLMVSDDGIGIPDSEKEKVFDKFYQVDNSTTRQVGGTGLGLAITKELVTLHGGEITLESADSKGCSFNILFPVADKAA